MSKIGRNDPCPCGSGKKYKKCCLNQIDRDVIETESRDRRIESIESIAYSRLVDQLMAMAETPSWKEEYQIAFNQFFFRNSYDGWEPEFGQQAFHAWLLYLRENANGFTAAEVFLEKRRNSLSQLDRQILSEMRNERFRIMEAQDIYPDFGLKLMDMHDHEIIIVKDRSLSRQINPWEMLLVRLRRFPSHNEVDMALLVSRRSRDWLTAQLNRSLDALRNDKPNASWHDLFTAHLPIVFDLILQAHKIAMRPPELRTSDGEEILLCEARYQVLDAKALKDVLDKHRSFDCVGPGEYYWLSGQRQNSITGQADKIVLGRITIKGRQVKLEAQSKKRLEKGKALLDRIAGATLKHLADAVQDWQQVLHHNDPSKSTESALSPEFEAELMPEVRKKFSEIWLTQRVPALDGMTPKEAANDPALRPRLVELLKDFENMAANSPNMAMDVVWLRRQLGLSNHD